MENISDNAIRSICVYCGSSPGNDPAFLEGANQLGTAIGEAGMRLVYGGGDSGLMGAVARATLEAGGTVNGIIPEFLKHLEQSRDGMGLNGIELEIVPDMHTRKQAMFERADAFVAMPGGIGTLEELVEILTWAQLDRHKKPIALLNINGFWSPYLNLIKHMSDAGFLHNPDKVKTLTFDRGEDVVNGLLAL